MAERKVDVAIIGPGPRASPPNRRVREYTERLVLIEDGPHGTTCAGSAACRAGSLIAAEAATRVAREPTT